ncbi:hypothetical protein IHE44_0012747 [Lamprotornis superbus]|uniref:Uncharacterized protein n=1 Tax=Lamprotornis superbus TaxID=245042 RepID=A0A835NDS7_9PASS|nr:hypothetical protein IHE44_0012747 [Lamprotornis superbus]
MQAGIPDVSGASLERSELSHVHGSASLQGPALPSSSQYPQPGDSGAASLPGELLGSRGDPEEVLGQGHSWSTAGKDGHCTGHSSQGTAGPAAGSELSDKDKESPGQEESSSSGNSYKTALTKFSERSEGGMQQEKVEVVGSGAGALEEQEEGKKVPELALADPFFGDLRKGHSGSSAAEDVCAGGEGEERGVGFRGSQGFGAAPEELQQAAGRLGTGQGTEPAGAPRQPQGTATHRAPSPGHSPGPAEPAGSRDELTGSDCSIERGHKGTEISPSFSLAAEGSFSVLLPHPNFQSTPGVFLKKPGKAEGAGALLIPLDSPSCSDEASGKSPGSLGKEHLPESTVKETCEHLESLKLGSPCPGRIQPFPCLSFLEKVGAWNVTQPGQCPDATSSAVPAAFPPARKTLSAPPRPSSCVLPAQKNLRDPEDCSAPGCRLTGSLGSLHFPGRSIASPALSRCQSDHAVNVGSRSRAWAGLVTEPLQLPGEENPALGGSDSTPAPSRTLRPHPGPGAADVGSPRRSSAPDVFVPSAAQLPKTNGSSPAGGHQDCEQKENPSLSLSIATAPDRLDKPGATSSGGWDVPGRNGEPRGAPGCAWGLPWPCPIPPGALLDTPKKEEMDIEERIPIYLRNLGIEQSPGTILAPFVPQRPLQELEFSPWQLRSLQDPLGTLARVPPQAQGVFQKEMCTAASL